jgi:hypothetical protein
VRRRSFHEGQYAMLMQAQSMLAGSSYASVRHSLDSKFIFKFKFILSAKRAKERVRASTPC